MGIKQRRMQANYIDVGAGETHDIVLMGTGYTALDENPSAQTTSRRYIIDKSATQSVSGYDWSVAFDIDQIREQAAVNYICRIGEMMLTGADAETDYFIIDIDQPESEDDTYHARKMRVAVAVDSFTNDDGNMGCTGNLLGIGDITEGTFDITAKTFTALTPTV